MPSKNTLLSWIPEYVQIFNQCMPLPVPEIHFAIATESALEKVQKDSIAAVESDSEPRLSGEWAGITFPGKKGSAVVMRASSIHGKQDFRHYLWHEIGHAYAFAYEGDVRLRITEQRQRRAYHIWAEFIADVISRKVGNSSGNPVGFTPTANLKKALSGNIAELAFYCSAAYFGAALPEVPDNINNLAALLKEKMKEERYWEIDMPFIEKIGSI